MYPAAFVLLKSNPNALSAAKFAPENLIFAGSIPSEPPWNGTVNLRSIALGPASPDNETEALKAPEYAAEAPPSLRPT